MRVSETRLLGVSFGAWAGLQRAIRSRSPTPSPTRCTLGPRPSRPAPGPLTAAFSPGVFIICWLPFFITHILNIHCDCNIPPVLYSAFTWLGYVNSAVNPIIYTTFNIEFRKAFLKILHC